jgi:2-polyprenyl-3-methyl-5-hydroxy-6-metoxy-1,4-benzoquinol methylase/predicted transcriptional regulator
MQSGEQPNPELVWDALNAHQKTAALRAAIDLDVFTAIAEGAHDVTEIARQCGASNRGIRILCDYLTLNGFLKKNGERYELTPTSAIFLNRHSPACMASVVHFLNSPQVMAGFANLTEAVRKGTTQFGQDGFIAPEFDGWVTFAESMSPLVRGATEFVASQAVKGGRSPRRVLDIAAGHGLFGIAVARMAPAAEIVAQDWPNVLKLAKRNAMEAGIGDRYGEVPGDFFAVELGENYDLVLLTNFLHHFDQQVCVDLLKKVHRSMTPGGVLITLEFVPNQDRVSPPIPASFSMMMLGLTPAGDAYTNEQLSRMMSEAGFGRNELIPVPQSPQHILVSVKESA